MKCNNNRSLLKLLGTLDNNVRVDIILFLISGERCVCEIFKNLKLSQNLVSHHIGILRESGLIVGRRDGKWIYYSLNIARFSDIENFIKIITSVKKIEKKSKC